eukprot:TRINITY_DN6813_c0_g1_i2.p1 TRINITY_DN6813_c0_g1~~TRINITY_DN6813_c0_g1_i2.p1  ORF type:complete len:411 (+),score=148.46 TRINITY_DN6813_c0_g1_i2:68-1234(+)
MSGRSRLDQSLEDYINERDASEERRGGGSRRRPRRSGRPAGGQDKSGGPVIVKSFLPPSLADPRAVEQRGERQRRGRLPPAAFDPPVQRSQPYRVALPPSRSQPLLQQGKPISVLPPPVALQGAGIPQSQQQQERLRLQQQEVLLQQQQLQRERLRLQQDQLQLQQAAAAAALQGSGTGVPVAAPLAAPFSGYPGLGATGAHHSAAAAGNHGLPQTAVGAVNQMRIQQQQQQQQLAAQREREQAELHQALLSAVEALRAQQEQAQRAEREQELQRRQQQAIAQQQQQIQQQLGALQSALAAQVSRAPDAARAADTAELSAMQEHCRGDTSTGGAAAALQGAATAGWQQRGSGGTGLGTAPPRLDDINAQLEAFLRRDGGSVPRMPWGT